MSIKVKKKKDDDDDEGDMVPVLCHRRRHTADRLGREFRRQTT